MTRPNSALRRAAPALAITSLAVAACASPGIDYQARIPAGSPVAAEYRAVAVDGFRGPEGGWFSDQFEQMLASAVFDGQPWFYVTTSYDQPDGVYRGRVDVDWVEEEYWRETEYKCVEWDGIFDCERRADVVKQCVEYTVHVSASPELVDLASGRPVWGGTWSSEASETECEDLGEVGTFRDNGRGDRYTERRNWHGPRWGGYYGGYIVDGLIQEALLETLPDIRVDIAPYNRRATAQLIDEAIDPEVKADPRFKFAIDAAKDNQFFASCEIFSAMAKDYPNAPEIKFNNGACAEASGDFATAQALYAEVSQTGVELPKTVRDALNRINSRRAGEVEINRLTGSDTGS